MLRMLRGASLIGIAMTVAAPSAIAATTSANMTVTITIQAQCTIQSANTLNFGTNGVITSNIDQATTIGVQCTSGQTYNVGLSAGAGAGATTAVRVMTGPASATINYAIYTDSNRTQTWGTTIGTDTVSGTGNGAVQNINVYGRVPPQTTPAAGVYTDTVAVTVTY